MQMGKKDIETRCCAKCGQWMQKGFIVEQNLTNYIPSVWVEGSPEPSFWTITKIAGKTKRLVVSYRCVECGYLESYATHEWKGKVDPE